MTEAAPITDRTDQAETGLRPGLAVRAATDEATTTREDRWDESND